MRKTLLFSFMATVCLALSSAAEAKLNCAEELVATRASALNDYWGRGSRWNLLRHQIVDPITWRTLRRLVGEEAGGETAPLPLVTDFQYYAKQKRSRVSRYVIDPLIDVAIRNLLRSFYQWDHEDHWNGLSQIPRRDRQDGSGAIILPHHPSPVDPVIQHYILSRWDPHVTFVMYEDQAHARPRFARYIKALLIPSERHKPEVRERMVNELIQYVVRERKRGRNFVIYPEGKITRMEPELQGQSAHWRMYQLDPNIRWIYAQLNGFAGDPFTAVVTGDFPDIAQSLVQRLFDLKASAFDVPRRQLYPTYELVTGKHFQSLREFSDDLVSFWRTGGRWNRPLLPPTWIPQREGDPKRSVVTPLPEHPEVIRTGTVEEVETQLRDLVLQKIADVSGAQVAQLRVTDGLQSNLGLDSIKVASLQLELEGMGGKKSDQPIQTVEEAILIAAGKLSVRGGLLPPPSGKWLAEIEEAKNDDRLAERPEGTTTDLEALRAQCEANPDFVIMHDDRGPVTYRSLIQRAMLFVPRIREMKGDTIVVNLPPSTSAMTVVVAGWLAGKKVIPMNAIADDAAVTHTARSNGAKSIITSEQFRQTLEGKGYRHPTLYAELDVYHLEGLAGAIPKLELLMTKKWSEESDFTRRLDWTVDPGPDAPTSYLATSGSSGKPKSVPFTPALNKRSGDITVKMFGLRRNDVIFDPNTKGHAVGWRLAIEALLRRVKVVYHANPSEYAVMARKMARYRVTVFPSVPDILDGVARTGTPIPTLRLILSGASKLTDAVRERLLAAWPQLRGNSIEESMVLEGIGSTESGPLIIGHRPGRYRPGTLGELGDGLEANIVDAETLAACEDRRNAGLEYSDLAAKLADLPPGTPGILLVRDKAGHGKGAIMAGYANYPAEKQPFVVIDGVKWWVSGDLFERDKDAPEYFIYRGRNGDLVKRYGEMVPILEMGNLLAADPRFTRQDDEIGPLLSVVAEKVEANPRICLFSSREITPLVARAITTKGTNGSSYADKVVYLPKIPTVGPLKPAKAFFELLMAEPDFWEKEWSPAEIEKRWETYTQAQ